MGDLRQVEADAVDAAYGDAIKRKFDTLHVEAISARSQDDLPALAEKIRKGVEILRSVRAAMLDALDLPTC